MQKVHKLARCYNLFYANLVHYKTTDFMARIIVITSGKGGVGKTTATSNIGMALAGLNRTTLLIDADVGLRNLDLLLGLENRIIYTGTDVLNDDCRLEQALIQDKRQPQLTFFPLSSNQAKNPVTIEQNQLASRALNIMEDKSITSLFILENNKPVGILHIHDILRAGVA